jgi:hypothetical protein
LVPHSAALDLPHALVEWATVLIVTREGARRCKLPPACPGRPGVPASARHPRPARRRVPHRHRDGVPLHTRAVDVLAAPAPDPAEAMQTAHAKAFVILDGTLLPIDRTAADTPYCSGKVRGAVGLLDVRRRGHRRGQALTRRSSTALPNRRADDDAPGRGGEAYQASFTGSRGCSRSVRPRSG